MKRNLTRASWPKVVMALSCSAMWLNGPGSSLRGDWKDDIGWTRLLTEYGPSVGNGAGVVVSMAEAPTGTGAYMPIPPGPPTGQFAGKTIINGTNTNSNQSGHSASVAQMFFGNTVSIAGGISQVTVFEAGNWMNVQMGMASGGDPLTQNFRVQNHSWISNDSNLTAIQNLLLRVDHVVKRDNITIVAGTTNSGAIPRALVHSYNTISVGRTDGGHGAGSTTFYGVGRPKPDIVAPQSTTSNATPIVSSAAAILHQAGAGTDATRSEVIRAMLMGGATKSEFPTWDRTVSRPLDEVYGAGELNIYNSYRILDAGEFDGSIGEPLTSAGAFGWDYSSGLPNTGESFYEFEIAPGQTWEDFSLLLTWNIDIIDQNGASNVFDPLAVFTDLNLDFFDSSQTFLGSLLDSSLASVGNVEHLFFESLGPGRYTLRVSGANNQAYGLAWSVSAVPEPSMGFIGGLLLAGRLVFSRRRRPSSC